MTVDVPWFMVQKLGFEVWVVAFRVQGLGLRVND